MTPILGGALIATVIAFLTGLLALLSQEGVESLGDISDLSLMILTIGAFLTFFKDFQSIWTRKMLGSRTGTSTGSPVPIGILALLMAVALMSACAGTKNAYRAAEGAEETAKVVSEHYYALVREANDLKARGVLRGSALASTQTVVRQTRPTVLQLGIIAQQYESVRSAANEAELQRAISDAAIAVSRLVDVIKAWRTTSATSDIETELDRIIQERAPFALAA